MRQDERKFKRDVDPISFKPIAMKPDEPPGGYRRRERHAAPDDQAAGPAHSRYY